jgi:hypothetical protein
VWNELVKAGTNGMTDFELEEIFGNHGSTYRTRRSELTEQGLIIDTGRTRVQRGRNRIVWAAITGGNMNAHSPPPINFEKMVAAYVALRDQIKAKEEEHKKELEPKKKMLEEINARLLTGLNQTGQDSAKTPAGTAYKKRFVSATIADRDMFKRHVIGAEAWELIDWRANKTAVDAFVKNHQDAPPGVTFTQGYDVGVRRSDKEDI